jgi:hypothetical protein
MIARRRSWRRPIFETAGSLPFHVENGAVPRVLIDRGTEERGTHDPHESKLALAVENIDPPAARAEPLAGFARTKAGSP